MVVIISEENDITTNLIVEWCIGYDIPCKRINANDYTKFSLEITNESEDVRLNEQKLPSKKIFFNRRGKINILPQVNLKDKCLFNYLKRETDSIDKSLELHFRAKNSYTGSYLKEVENYKISHLLNAKKAGLKIPPTLITNTKKELVLFYNTYKPIITKDIRYPYNHQKKANKYSSIGTHEVKEDMLANLKEDFFPMLVQQKIEKKFEIRAFVFQAELYAMAIFSQNSPETKLDYRNFDINKPTRTTPFIIPDSIQEKIFDFMRISDLDTGSIDLIVDTNNQYIFLEINPQGQIDWLSKNCNYYIEKEITQKLIVYE